MRGLTLFALLSTAVVAATAFNASITVDLLSSSAGRRFDGIGGLRCGGWPTYRSPNQTQALAVSPLAPHSPPVPARLAGSAGRASVAC
jgi:hypothetical protein